MTPDGVTLDEVTPVQTPCVEITPPDMTIDKMSPDELSPNMR